MADEAVPLIVNQLNFLLRLVQIKKLALVTGVDEEFLRHEVTRRVDEQSSTVKEERNLIVTRLVSDMKKNPDAAMELMRQATTQIEVIEKRKEGYDPRQVLASYEHMFDQQMAHTSNIGVRTGFPIWNKQLSGLPRGAAFISVPGKPNQGKTSFCSNLAWRIPEHNDDVITVFHTVDDALEQAIPRILGSRSHLPSKLFQRAGYFLNNPDGKNEVAQYWPQFPQVYHESKQWLNDMIQQERLIVTDINQLPGSLPALDDWLKTLRKRFPSTPMVCMAITSRFTSSKSPQILKLSGRGRSRNMSNAWLTCNRPACS